MTYYEDPTFDNCDSIRYGVVLNDINWENFSEEINLSGWILSKASVEEAVICTVEVSKYRKPYGSSSYGNKHLEKAAIFQKPSQETEITFDNSDKNSYSIELLPNLSSWRYTVVRRSSEAKLKGSQLCEATLISDANLFIDIWCIEAEDHYPLGYQFPNNIIGGSPLACLQFSLNPPLPETLSKLDIKHLQDVVALRAKFDDAKYPVVITAIQMFRELQIIPPSLVKILGYFSLIESLLSHAPSPNDSIGSITRQLQRNLIFIHNRLPDDYSLGLNEFDNVPAQTVISKLYAYRSMIAHGGTDTTALNWLLEKHKPNEGKPWAETGIQWAERFIRRLIKRVLVYALREPDIVLDLKGISHKK